MTKLKIGVMLLVVLLVASGSVATDAANPRHTSISSHAAAARSDDTTNTVETAALPSHSATPGCVARETVVPNAQCSCPPSVAEAPSPVLCPPIPPPSTPNRPPNASIPPVITFCPTAPVAIQTAPGTIQIQSFVCGRGFSADETVTLAATGAGHTISWQLAASSSGTFASPLPPLLCRLAPVTLVATGSTGDRSNSLLLSATSCLPTL